MMPFALSRYVLILFSRWHTDVNHVTHCVLLKPNLGNLSESLSPSLWSSAVVVLKPPSPSTLRTLQPLFHPGGSFPILLDMKYETRFTLQRTTCHC